MKSEQYSHEVNTPILDENTFITTQVNSQMLTCLKGNPSSLLCQNKFCDKVSFICSNSDCECRLHHSKCLKTFTNQFFTEINKKFYSTTQIKKKVNTIIDQAIDYISKIRDDIYLDLKYLGLNQDQRQLMEIINKNQIQSVKGSMIWKVCQGIYQQKKLQSNFILKELNKFWKTNQKKFKRGFEKIKQLAQIQSDSVIKIFQSSEILKRSSDINNLLSFFSLQIKSAKLIYSPKQNKFKMTKFHQLCSSMKNNLVIIRNKEGNIFGGFSDISITNGNNGGPTRYGKSQKAFVFSITNNQKFTVKLPFTTLSAANAILYNNLEGPNFGNNFLGIYRFHLPNLGKQKRTTFGVGNPNIQPFQAQPINAFGTGGFGEINAFYPDMQEGFNQKRKQITEHYCISSQGQVYQNQKYSNAQSIRQVLTGQTEIVFPITEWEVFQLQFQEP